MTMPRTARCAAVNEALNPSLSGKQCAAISRVLITRNRFAKNNERVQIRSFKTFVDNVAANPRVTFFCGSGAGGGARDGAAGGGVVVHGAGTATEACNSTGAGDGSSLVPCGATAATGDGTSAASGATGALPFLPPGTAVFATVARALATAVVGGGAAVGSALVSVGVVSGSLVFLVMSQAP